MAGVGIGMAVSAGAVVDHRIVATVDVCALATLVQHVTFASESKLAVFSLVLHHVNKVREHFSTIATYQDVRAAVSFEVAKLLWNGFWYVACTLVRGPSVGRTELFGRRGAKLTP